MYIFSSFGKNAWISVLKWFNYVDCPAEGAPLCLLLRALMSGIYLVKM